MEYEKSADEKVRLRGQLIFSRDHHRLFFLGQAAPGSDDSVNAMVRSRSTSEVVKEKDSKRRGKKSRHGSSRGTGRSPPLLSLLTGGDRTSESTEPSEDDEDETASVDSVESVAAAAGASSENSPRPPKPALVPPLTASPTRAREDDSTPIEVVLRRIFTQVLKIELKTAYDDQFVECIYKLKKNCISNLGLLFRLPSARSIEKMNLPLLVESELVSLYSIRAHFDEPMVPRLSPTEKRAPDAGETKPLTKSSVLGLTAEMRSAVKQTWAEISSARLNGSQLNQFFDHLLKELSLLDYRAGSILENMPLRDQSDTLLGLLAYIVRAVDDPIRSIASIRQVAVRFLILGFDKSTFPSLTAAIPCAVEKTLGAEKAPPAVREAWFALAKSIFDVLVSEYEPLKDGVVGRLWKLHDRKWRVFTTVLLPDRIVFYKEGSQTDKKDEILLSTVESPSTVKEMEGQPNSCGFFIETTSGSKSHLCAENESALTQWTNDISRRIRALSILVTSSDAMAMSSKKGK